LETAFYLSNSVIFLVTSPLHNPIKKSFYDSKKRSILFYKLSKSHSYKEQRPYAIGNEQNTLLLELMHFFYLFLTVAKLDFKKLLEYNTC